MSGLKVDKFIKKQTYTKTEAYKLYILDYFEYFCQFSSKSIVIISSYTVSKLTPFFETQCSLTSCIERHCTLFDGGSSPDTIRRRVLWKTGLTYTRRCPSLPIYQTLSDLFCEVDESSPPKAAASQFNAFVLSLSWELRRLSFCVRLPWSAFHEEAYLTPCRKKR